MNRSATSRLHVAGQVPQAFLDGNRPLTSFVAAPGIFSVIMAFLAGVAGTLSLTGNKSGPLVGMFISVTTLEEKPANGDTHWSTRSMAAQAGMNQTAVSRIWRAFGLNARAVQSWKLSTDPQFVE